MAKLALYCCGLALVAVLWSAAPTPVLATDRDSVVASFDGARGLGGQVSPQARTFGGPPAVPGPGFGNFPPTSAFALVTSIYERLGLDRSFVRPPSISPN